MSSARIMFHSKFSLLCSFSVKVERDCLPLGTFRGSATIEINSAVIRYGHVGSCWETSPDKSVLLLLLWLPMIPVTISYQDLAEEKSKPALSHLSLVGRCYHELTNISFFANFKIRLHFSCCAPLDKTINGASINLYPQNND